MSRSECGRRRSIWVLAGLLSFLSGCRVDDERAQTSNVTKVVNLPADGLDVAPGGTIELGLQAIDSSGIGVNGVGTFFASNSSKLSVSDGSGLETFATTGTGSFSNVSGDGIATTKWSAASDAAAGEVFVFGYLLADSSEDHAITEAERLGVHTFTITIKAVK